MATLSWMRSDPSLKIASFVLAIFVWLYVRSEDKPIQVLSVPLEISGLPDDLALAGRTLEHVAVRVRGPEATLRNLTPGRVQAQARLVDPQPGEHQLELTPDVVRAPIGVEVLSVDPPQLTLTLERRATRAVPVVARFQGSPAAPLEQAGYTVTPDQVTVQGPERIIRQVRHALTDAVVLDGRKESFETVVGLQPDRNGVRILDKAVALVRVSLREPPATRSFENVELVPLLPARSPHAVRCHPERVTVVLEGNSQALAALEPENVRAVLNLEGMGPRAAPYSVQPRVSIHPEEKGLGVVVRSISHQTIHVTVIRRGGR
jgi:YbbR domain-containing protein